MIFYLVHQPDDICKWLCDLLYQSIIKSVLQPLTFPWSVLTNKTKIDYGNTKNWCLAVLIKNYKILCDQHPLYHLGAVIVERSPCMREIRVRSPVGTDVIKSTVMVRLQMSEIISSGTENTKQINIQTNTPWFSGDIHQWSVSFTNYNGTELCRINDWLSRSSVFFYRIIGRLYKHNKIFDWK